MVEFWITRKTPLRSTHWQKPWFGSMVIYVIRERIKISTSEKKKTRYLMRGKEFLQDITVDDFDFVRVCNKIRKPD